MTKAAFPVAGHSDVLQHSVVDSPPACCIFQIVYSMSYASISSQSDSCYDVLLLYQLKGHVSAM